MLLRMPLCTRRPSAFSTLVIAIAIITILFFLQRHTNIANALADRLPASAPAPATAPAPQPKYKPSPTYTPPPVTDPFPLLATATPPPIPEWNRPRRDQHTEDGLPVAPPLLIGFTRTWPLLLQAVVSYLTAGWPAEQIYVVENTGTQQANPRRQLTLQNPFFLDHAALARLGVNVVQTPALLTFAQLQNFFLSLSYAHAWPYYFWSHMDVLALAYEDGASDGLNPRATEPGYRSLYALALAALAETRRGDDHWGMRFFAYDHLALVNPLAYEAVGGWDTLIPYYLTDCDMHSRLTMGNWSIKDMRAGIITDVGGVLDDLAVLYRVPDLKPSFTNPNPHPPEDPKKDQKKQRRQLEQPEEEQQEQRQRRREVDPPAKTSPLATAEQLEQWRALQRTADGMFHAKHADNRGRNVWQTAQRGGVGEPFYYDAMGMAEAVEILIEAGRAVFRAKWGHRDCDLITGAGLQAGDAWRVEKDW